MKFNTNLIFGPERAVPLRQIHEIEFSSRCNLACRYCPHPKMARAKADMTRETFDETMAHLQHLCDAGTQGEVSLTGIGEALLHPEFEPWLKVVRSVVGRDRLIVLATNGLLMTPDIAALCAREGVSVYVSTHRPEKAGPAVKMLQDAKCKHGTNTAFVDSAFDWAGQVPWYVNTEVNACAYLANGWGAVRQDGSVNTCCMDAESHHPVGNVTDPVGSLRTFATPICADCHLVVGKEFRRAGIWPEPLVEFVKKRKINEQRAEGVAA